MLTVPVFVRQLVSLIVTVDRILKHLVCKIHQYDLISTEGKGTESVYTLSVIQNLQEGLKFCAMLKLFVFLFFLGLQHIRESYTHSPIGLVASVDSSHHTKVVQITQTAHFRGCSCVNLQEST